MALIDGAVGGEEVEVVLALRIPDIDALGTGEDDGQRVVVVGGILILGSDGAVCGRGVVSRVAGVGGGWRGVVGVGGHGGWLLCAWGV